MAQLAQPSLLWVDLEMTGLDPHADRILEIAAIITNWQLDTLSEFSKPVFVDPQLVERRMAGEFWERHKETKTDLITRSATAEPIGIVEAQLLDWLKSWFHDDQVIVLAGNSIHQDRKFIDLEMPGLASRLHHRMFDVSAWKLYFEQVHNTKFYKPEQHRALADIQGSIAEFKFYRDRFLIRK